MLRPSRLIVLAAVCVAATSGCATTPRRPAVAPAVAPTSPDAVRPSIVLVSIDGFRPADIDRPGAANLRRLAERGVRARWMTPVFPTKTYPNHYTIATGLWPAHHGIVSNTMWDSAIGYRFEFQKARAVSDARWWAGEPIWVTAERQGRRAAVEAG